MTETPSARFFDAWTFLKTRKLSALALVTTVVMLLLSLTQPPQQIEWLAADNGIAIQYLQIIYALLALALALVFAYEPAIRRELNEAHALGALAVVSLGVCFLVVRLIKPDQAWRFFRTPGIVWFVVVHAVLLCGLALLLVLDRPDESASSRVRRYALLVVTLGGIVMAALHIASVGEFMRLDLPDEVWLGSLATNTISHGAYYSSLNVGAFGIPDPLFSRYYLLMSVWLRLVGDQSLVTLRAFSLLVAAAGVGMTAWILLRQPLSTLQRVVGLVVLLGFSPLVRTSHNLRMDVGLVVYGALLLLGLLHFFKDWRSRWLAMLGSTLFLGIELIPPLALAVNGVIGCALILFAISGRIRWRKVILYAGVCAISVLAYAAFQFLPGAPDSLSGFSLYNSTYYSGGVGLNLAHILDYLKTSAFLSPVELLVVAAVFALAWRTDRVLVLIVGAAALLVMSIRSSSYGYLTVFAPFLAYFGARVFRSQTVVTLGAFVLIPALLSAPIYDMTTAIETQVNRRTLEEVDLLSWRVPDGATVWGDNVFWFTLRDQVTFVGTAAPHDLAIARGITPLSAVQQLGVDVIICNSLDATMCSIGEQLFGAPYEFVVTDAHYLMYSALGSQ